MVLTTLENCATTSVKKWTSDLWAFLIGIEHERLHLETSCPIIRQLPVQMVKIVTELVECDKRSVNISDLPKNKMVEVEGWKGEWPNTSTDQPKVYGWDNEFGERDFNVHPFTTSQMLVSNGEFFEFVQDQGYQTEKWWTDEGKKWLKSKAQMPRFWLNKGGKWMLRTICQEIDMPWDWPVEVNNLEARAFCKWKTDKCGKYTRLPT